MKNAKNVRKRVYDEANGCCHWCGRKTQLIEPEKGKRTPGNLATVDHVYPRGDARRHHKQDGLVRLILSCWKCNHKRGKAPYDEFLMRMQPHWWTAKQAMEKAA